MLALLDVESPAKTLLEKFGVRRDAAFRTLAQLRGSTRVVDETPETKFQVLEKYAVNMTERAKKGELDPVIGWKRRSRAGSFSMYFWYSRMVVAPIACSSPRASAGFKRLDASTAPSAAPAPTIV